MIASWIMRILIANLVQVQPYLMVANFRRESVGFIKTTYVSPITSSSHRTRALVYRVCIFNCARGSPPARMDDCDECERSLSS